MPLATAYANRILASEVYHTVQHSSHKLTSHGLSYSSRAPRCVTRWSLKQVLTSTSCLQGVFVVQRRLGMQASQVSTSDVRCVRRGFSAGVVLAPPRSQPGL